jgi:transposase
VEAVARGEKPTVVARVFNIPLRCVFHWIARYRHGGYDALREGKRVGRPRKVNGEVMQWQYEAITLGDPQQHQFEFCLWTLGIIRTLLKRQHGIELSKSGAVIYFVDEAAVRADGHRGTTWAPVGETPVIEDSGDRFGLKLISAVSPRGDFKFAVFEGHMTSERFVGFVKKLRADTGKPIIVIADNAKYHKKGMAKRFLKPTPEGIQIAHLPTYASELDPDEQVWNHLKRRLGKLFLESKQQMREQVRSILQSIQRSANLLRSFFQLTDTKYAADAI